jgi:orotate phosphoribosyltransferase
MTVLLKDTELIQLALELYDHGAFRDRFRNYESPPIVVERSNGERGFKLKHHEKEPDAPLSPFYLTLRTADHPDPNRRGPLTDDIVALAGDRLGAYAFNSGLSFDAVVGLPNAGVPFAEAFPRTSWITGQSITKLWLRKEVHKDERRVVGPPEGDFQPGQTVLVIDDLITRADTKLEGIKALEAAGLVVKDVLVIVDRQQGGAQELERGDYCLHALFPVRALLDTYVEHRRISSKLREEIILYLET